MQNQMNGYPANFVAKAKKLYPNWTELHQALASGSELVGRYLDDSCDGKLDCREVMKAESLREVKAMAKRELAKVELYSEWCELRRKMFRW